MLSRNEDEGFSYKAVEQEQSTASFLRCLRESCLLEAALRLSKSNRVIPLQKIIESQQERGRSQRCAHIGARSFGARWYGESKEEGEKAEGEGDAPFMRATRSCAEGHDTDVTLDLGARQRVQGTNVSRGDLARAPSPSLPPAPSSFRPRDERFAFRRRAAAAPDIRGAR